MKTKSFIFTFCTFALFATVVKGLTVDGTAEAGYGSAISVQQLGTSGLDNDMGVPDQSDGSEIDAAYGVISNGVLYLVIAGNLDSGGTGNPNSVPFDKLHVFFMTGPGGDNTLGTNYSYNVDFGHLNRMGINGFYNGVAANANPGLTFDPTFAANYWIEATIGGAGAGPTFYANYAQICSGCPGSFLGSVSPTNSPNVIVDPITGIQIALNNTNTLGVDNLPCPTNGSNVAQSVGAATVRTGVEMAVPLSAIGNPQTSVSVCVFITDDQCDALYDQVLGPVATNGCLSGSYLFLSPDGDSTSVNFGNLPGQHYFTFAVPPCNTIAVSPASVSFGTSVATSNEVVTLGGTCGWAVANSIPWVTITSAPNGTGSGSFTYSVATNTTIDPRSGVLTIYGTTVPVTQTVSIAQDGVVVPPLGSIVVDGTVEPGYGCPLAVQAIGTGYGNNNTTNRGTANGSELDAAYGLIQNNTLFLTLTGNLQNNNNHLHLFFMTGPGGLNSLTNVEPTAIGGNILNGMGATTNGAAVPAPGLTFDPGFNPNYWLGVNIGSTAGFPYILYVDYAQLWPGGTNATGIATNGYFVGSNIVATTGTLLPSQNPFHIQATVNNSNTNGVDGGPGGGSGCLTNNSGLSLESSNAALVATGIELAIPLGALGGPTGSISVCIFIGGGSSGFMSNQLLPPIDPTGQTNECYGNLGNGSVQNVNFGNLPGLHSFMVGPEARITSISLVNTNIQISYLTENNTNLAYRVERTPAPLSATSTWTSVTGFVPGTGGIIGPVIDIKAGTNRPAMFYRVRQSPQCNAP